MLSNEGALNLPGAVGVDLALSLELMGGWLLFRLGVAGRRGAMGPVWRSREPPGRQRPRGPESGTCRLEQKACETTSSGIKNNEQYCQVKCRDLPIAIKRIRRLQLSCGAGTHFGTRFHGYAETTATFPPGIRFRSWGFGDRSIRRRHPGRISGWRSRHGNRSDWSPSACSR